MILISGQPPLQQHSEYPALCLAVAGVGGEDWAHGGGGGNGTLKVEIFRRDLGNHFPSLQDDALNDDNSDEKAAKLRHADLFLVQ